mmetsp:Transcript_15004/g.13552  ORF Transcript_15004/g.13552 Transcript_15004/m.13552 type:complete len:369 (+) Transcript_15004:105-1211(+)
MSNKFDDKSADNTKMSSILSDVTPELSMVFSVDSENSNTIKLVETPVHSLVSWNQYDDNKPLLVGMGFGVCITSDRLTMRFGTIGPSVKSIYPLNEIPDNWFFTSAEIFRTENGNYLDESYVFDSRNNMIGSLISVNNVIGWAIIEIYRGICSPNVKISINGASLPIIGTIHFDTVIYSDFNWPNVFKSGSASGITKGKIFSWGQHINKKEFPMHISDNVVKPNEILIQRVNSSESFAISGDIGAPLFFLKDNSAVCAGLVTASLLIHENLKLTVISPIYSNQYHIINFVKSALQSVGILENTIDLNYNPSKEEIIYLNEDFDKQTDHDKSIQSNHEILDSKDKISNLIQDKESAHSLLVQEKDDLRV